MLPFDLVIPEYFLAALAAGVLYTVYVRPAPTVITRHPTPYNGATTYKDGAGTCYRYDAAQTACPAAGAVQFKVVDAPKQ